MFKAGGLLFLYEEELRRGYVLKSDRTLHQFAAGYRGSHDLQNFASWFAAEIIPDESAMDFDTTMQSYWSWEVRIHKRDRWKELLARGGEVSNYWLTVDPSALDFATVLRPVYRPVDSV